MSLDLVEFYWARLDEEAQAAQAAPGPSWERRQITGDHDQSVVFEDYVAVADPNRDTVVLSDVGPEVLPFVLRQDPASVLADIEVKRQLTARADTLFCECDRYGPSTDPDDRSHHVPHRYDCTAYRIARALAVRYADHPDYKEAWRP